MLAGAAPIRGAAKQRGVAAGAAGRRPSEAMTKMVFESEGELWPAVSAPVAAAAAPAPLPAGGGGGGGGAWGAHRSWSNIAASGGSTSAAQRTATATHAVVMYVYFKNRF